MGQEITDSHFTQEDFDEFQSRLRAETRLLEDWYRNGVFSDTGGVGGFELEAWLVDCNGQPTGINQAYLERLNNPLVVSELATFNVEVNSTPQSLRGDALSRIAQELESTWVDCNRVAEDLHARLVMIGILPTLDIGQLNLDYMSPLQRYQALNDQVLRLREGRPIELNIRGCEQLQLQHTDVMLESAATSFQIHLKVAPHEAARVFNASKVLSAPMVAACANSPYLFERDLWDETRIPLFEQAVAVGNSNLTQRVSFGVRYVQESIIECFQANLDRYPVLLPHLMDEGEDQLAHLRLHNGTIWRWNRPLIGFDEDGRPHLRIEHRVVPSGPSVQDSIANAALYYGMVRALADQPRPVESRLLFDQAKANFYLAARDGLAANIFWLDRRRINLRSLLLKELLPLAHQGLMSMGLDLDEAQHWLGLIRARLETGQTGAAWQRQFVRAHGKDMKAMTEAYIVHQASGMPVHLWPV